jgi:ligand-binding sensor domain-containing protein
LSGSRTSRKVHSVVLLCGCVALSSLPLLALDPNRPIEQYVITKWNSRNGFPGGAVHAIAQTPDGYLWLGAENGLVRFDGITFRLFDHSNTPSLPVGHVLDLTVDSSGVLWVRMESPYLLRYRGGTYEQAYPTKLNQPGVTAIARGHREGVLIAPTDAPLRYREGRFTPLVESGRDGGLAISIAETDDGVVWVGMRDTGLTRIRDGHSAEVPGLPDQKVNVLLPGTNSELWIGTDAGLVRWDGERITRSGVPLPLAHSQILALARDRNSNLQQSESGECDLRGPRRQRLVRRP